MFAYSWVLALQRLLLVGLAIAPTCCGITLADDREVVEQWISTRPALDAPLPPGAHLHLKLTRTATCRVSVGDATAIFRSVQALPDHPDRARAERVMRLAQQPEVTTAEVWLSHDGTWSLKRIEPAGVLTSGGVADTRWLLFEREGGGQLTIIRRGVPFPSGANVSRYLDQSREIVSLVVHQALAALPAGSVLRSVDVRGSEWTATLDPGDASMRSTLTGVLAGDPLRPLVTSLVMTWPTESGHAAQTWTFQEQAVIPGTNLSISKRIVVDMPDGITERTDVELAEAVGPEDVRTQASLPTPSPDIAVADFRRIDSPAWRGYAGSATAVWSGDGQGMTIAHSGDASEQSRNTPPAITPAARGRQLIALLLTAGAGTIILMSARGVGKRLKSRRSEHESGIGKGI